MSKQKPTTREFLLSAYDPELESQFFSRIKLQNGTLKKTLAHRLDDMNQLMLPYICQTTERPVKIMDVAVSSGISTVEWYEHLRANGVDCQFAATDSTIFAGLLSLTGHFAALVDAESRIIHLDLFGRGTTPEAEGWKGVVIAFFKQVFRFAMRVGLKRKEVLLLSSRLYQYKNRIQIYEDDLTVSNKIEFRNAFHVLRAANILNRLYHTDDVLLRMTRNLVDRLMDGGLLIICRTEQNGRNHAAIFRRSGRELLPLVRTGDGCELENIIVKV